MADKRPSSQAGKRMVRMSRITIYDGYIPMDFTVMDSGMPQEKPLAFVAAEYAVEQERRLQVMKAAVEYWKAEARLFKTLYVLTLISASAIILLMALV